MCGANVKRFSTSFPRWISVLFFQILGFGHSKSWCLLIYVLMFACVCVKKIGVFWCLFFLLCLKFVGMSIMTKFRSVWLEQ